MMTHAVQHRFAEWNHVIAGVLHVKLDYYVRAHYYTVGTTNSNILVHGKLCSTSKVAHNYCLASPAFCFVPNHSTKNINNIYLQLAPAHDREENLVL